MIQVERDPAQAWRLSLSKAELRDLLKAMLAALGRPDSHMDLAVLDDAAMEDLNRAWLDCPGPTNVLSFPSPSLPGQQEHLGSLALAAQTLEREAFLYGRDPAGYAKTLLAHGLVHLLGHDHGPEMDRLVQKALAAI